MLLRGESGTGKGVLARALHAQSPRAARPFVVVNCPTLSEELLASELFGHARGAFTGAVRDQAGPRRGRRGRHALPRRDRRDRRPALQAKLLRFLQEREFERVGETRTRRADVRIVAATNRDLAADVAAGRFREDLYWRLAVVEIRVPPLRERPEDVLRLARRFLAFFDRARPGARAQTLSPAAAQRALLAHGWPGNVRELRNAMERCAILWPADVVEPEALPERIAGARRRRAPRVGGDCTARGARARARAARPRAGADARGGRAHPRHRRVDALAQAQALRALSGAPAAAGARAAA